MADDPPPSGPRWWRRLVGRDATPPYDPDAPPPPVDDDTAEFLSPLADTELAGLRGTAPRGIEEEASTMVGKYLFPTEKFRGEWNKHWIYLVKEFVIGAVATFLMGWLAGFLHRHNQDTFVSVTVIIWLGVMGYVGWKLVDWWYDKFILTNKRIMVVNGLVTRTVGMMPLARVTDMKYEQSPLGRLLNYGTFVVESAGQDQALRTVKPLPNPNELYLRIVEEMYEPEAVEARLSRQAEEARAADA